MCLIILCFECWRLCIKITEIIWDLEWSYPRVGKFDLCSWLGVAKSSSDQPRVSVSGGGNLLLRHLMLMVLTFYRGVACQGRISESVGFAEASPLAILGLWCLSLGLWGCRKRCSFPHPLSHSWSQETPTVGKLTPPRAHLPCPAAILSHCFVSPPAEGCSNYIVSSD